VAWHAGRVSNPLLPDAGTHYPQPHVEVAKFDPPANQLFNVTFDQVALYNDQYALSFPALATDGTDVAMTFITDGPARWPTLDAGFLTDSTFVDVAAGNASSGRLGDYQAVRPVPGFPHCFAAAGGIVQTLGAPLGTRTTASLPVFAVYGRPGQCLAATDQSFNKRTSSLSLSCPAHADQGSTVTLTGFLSPSLANRDVAVDVSGPGQHLVLPARTDASGGFTVSFSPAAVGSYSAFAGYGGDDTTTAAVSPACGIDVRTPQPPPPTGPDLTVTGVFNTHFIVKNIGNAGSPATTAAQTASDGKNGTYNVHALAPGEEQDIGTTCHLDGSIHVVVDPDDTVTELDETNNAADGVGSASCIH
jgi:hypothetical protein